MTILKEEESSHVCKVLGNVSLRSWVWRWGAYPHSLFFKEMTVFCLDDYTPQRGKLLMESVMYAANIPFSHSSSLYHVHTHTHTHTNVRVYWVCYQSLRSQILSYTMDSITTCWLPGEQLSVCCAHTLQEGLRNIRRPCDTYLLFNHKLIIIPA